MKKFIIKILTFFIIFISFVILFNILFSLYNSKIENCYIIDKSKNILILGDSHIACAIDDSIVLKSVNISEGADAYFYSFIKLRKFLSINPGIKLVALGIDEHSLYNTNWFNSPEIMRGKCKRYFRLMNLNDFKILLEANGVEFLVDFLGASFFSFFKTVLTSESDYRDMGLGGYQNLKKDKLNEAIEKYKKDKKQNSIDGTYSENQVEYLLKIVDLCKKHKIKLILLNTPTYIYFTNESESRKLSKFIKRIIDNYVEYWDYSNYLLPNFCYGDFDHLNYRGAEIFSKKLNNDIEKYLDCN